MVSSAYSGRRGILRRPKICKPPPPPPPPPPPAWPPASFNLYFQYCYNWFGGPQCEDWSIDVPRFMSSWDWVRENAPPDNESVWWKVDQVAHTATLEIIGESIDFGAYRAWNDNVPLVWGVPTFYSISSWTFLTPGLLSAVAEFTF